jgi:hypothetical protein
MSSGSTSPPIRVASSAATRNVSTSRVTSPRLSLIVLPASTHSASASSSARSWNRLAQWCRTAARRCDGNAAIAGAASAASSIARSIAVASARATRAATSPVNLSWTARSVFGCSATPPR